jgi:hypothetical protein
VAHSWQEMVCRSVGRSNLARPCRDGDLFERATLGAALPPPGSVGPPLPLAAGPPHLFCSLLAAALPGGPPHPGLRRGVGRGVQRARGQVLSGPAAPASRGADHQGEARPGGRQQRCAASKPPAPWTMLAGPQGRWWKGACWPHPGPAADQLLGGEKTYVQNRVQQGLLVIRCSAAARCGCVLCVPAVWLHGLAGSCADWGGTLCVAGGPARTRPAR